MKVSFLPSSRSAVPLPSHLFPASVLALPRRLGLGLRKTAAATMCGNRESDPDLSEQERPSSLRAPIAESEGGSAAEAADGLKKEDRDAPIEDSEGWLAAEAADGLKKEDPDIDLLQKQLGEPPEKPLPGDCCGSGCVRCVWDIYYEELEDYNSRKASLDTQRASHA